MAKKCVSFFADWGGEGPPAAVVFFDKKEAPIDLVKDPVLIPKMRTKKKESVKEKKRKRKKMCNDKHPWLSGYKLFIKESDEKIRALEKVYGTFDKAAANLWKEQSDKEWREKSANLSESDIDFLFDQEDRTLSTIEFKKKCGKRGKDGGEKRVRIDEGFLDELLREEAVALP